jgi:hypothetical protein
MSAIGISVRNAAYKPRAMVIGAHADYRPEDFFFARTQSVALREAKWESRIKPMHSWSEIALYSAGLVAILIAGLSFA